jgi:hypothetical protein
VEKASGLVDDLDGIQGISVMIQER